MSNKADKKKIKKRKKKKKKLPIIEFSKLEI